MYGNGEGVVRVVRSTVPLSMLDSTSVVFSLLIHSWLHPKSSDLKSAAPGRKWRRSASPRAATIFVGELVLFARTHNN